MPSTEIYEVFIRIQDCASDLPTPVNDVSIGWYLMWYMMLLLRWVVGIIKHDVQVTEKDGVCFKNF